MTNGPNRKAISAGLLLVAALAVGGCDKCGHRVNINVPSVPHACSDQVGTAK